MSAGVCWKQSLEHFLMENFIFSIYKRTLGADNMKPNMFQFSGSLRNKNCLYCWDKNLRRILHAFLLANWVDLFMFVNLIESIYHLIFYRWILFIQRAIFMDFLLPSTYRRQHHRSTILLDRHGVVKREL